MSMKKKILLIAILCSALLVNKCSQPQIENQNKEKKLDATTISSGEQTLSYRNPALMAGTDLLTLFRRLYINQNYASMLKFTSHRSILQFGESSIMEFYKSPNLLGADVKLKSIKYESDSLKCSMNYEVIFFATKNIRMIKCLIENDTAKFSLCDLKTVFCN